MAHIVCNISKGRVAEMYDRVKNNDPATSRLVFIPLETIGLEADSVLIDKDDVAALLSGATNEQTTMGRKYLTDADLSAGSPDDTNDRNERSTPAVVWTGATGNAISKIAVCYDPNSSADSAIVPLTIFDFTATPSGLDIQVNAGVFFRAS